MSTASDMVFQQMMSDGRENPYGKFSKGMAPRYQDEMEGLISQMEAAQNAGDYPAMFNLLLQIRQRTPAANITPEDILADPSRYRETTPPGEERPISLEDLLLRR